MDRGLTWRIPILIALFYGFLMGVWWDSPLWYDEAWMVDRVALARDPLQPYLYRALLALWLPSVGETLFSYRLLHLLLGVSAVLVLARVARESDADPLASTLVFAGFPLVLLYGHEIRPYGLLLLLATLCLGGLLRAEHRPDWRAYALAGGAGLGAAYTHPAGVVTVLGPLLLGLALQCWRSPAPERRIRLVGLGLVLATQLVALAPLLPRLVQAKQGFYDLVPQIHPGPTPGTVARVLSELSHGAGGGPWFEWPALGLLVLLLVRGLRRPASDSPDPDCPRRDPRLLLVSFALAPPLLAALASVYKPMFVARVLLPSLAPVALLAGRAWPGRIRLRLGLTSALFLLGVALFSRGTWLREDMPAVLREIAKTARLGDGLVVHPPFASVTYQANARLGEVSLPALFPQHLNAPTPLRAVEALYEQLPRRTFFVLQGFQGRSQALEQELPLRFARVSLLGEFRGPFRLVLCEGPLDPDAVLLRSQGVGTRAWLHAYREGVLASRRAAHVAALEAYQRARELFPPGEARDELERRDTLQALSWAVARSALLVGEQQLAQQALEEAERAGLRLRAEERVQFQVD